MTESDVEFYLEQIGSHRNVRSIVMSGGEPFVRRRLVERAVRKAGGYGITSGVNTNCYWATSLDAARRILEPLREHGMDRLGVSLDAVHGEFVPQERVGYAAQAALQAGMSLEINAVHLEGETSTPESVAAALGLTPDVIGFYNHIGRTLRFSLGAIVPAGTAANSYKANQYLKRHVDDELQPELRAACSMVLNTSVITPGGDYAACCSPSAATPVGFHPEFLIGNLHRTPFSELVGALERHPVFAEIADRGPKALYDLVVAKAPALLPSKEFVNICDMCVKVLRNPAARRIVEEHYGLTRLGAEPTPATLERGKSPRQTVSLESP